MNVSLVCIEQHQTHIHARRSGAGGAEDRGADMAEEPAAGMADGGAPSRAEVCVVACAEAWRGDGAILASPMGLIPTLGAKLARLTFSPGLLLTDGEATLLAPDGAGNAAEGWLPYRSVFTMLAAGLRHVMMGAAQLDRFGNQNISCIGDHTSPKAQLLGVRGAPGNTINHPVSYWVPRHSGRVFVERADMVCGIGYDRAAALGPGQARFHELRVVVTNLAVLDFATPDHTMRLRSVHPGVAVDDVAAATGFPLAIPDEVPVTRLPAPGELALIRSRLDPRGLLDGALA
jgi:acyl CoA:acetate/3-ketoacid CoA transferase beta subunit